MKMIDIIKKLIGEVEPYGDSNIDRERYKNLDLLGEVTNELICRLGGIADYRDDNRYSVSKMGKLAYEDLIIIKEYIETIID